MRVQWLFVVVTFFILAGTPALAGVNPNAGTTGYNFLKIGIAARPAAFGGAFTAVGGDISGVVSNPAAIATIIRGTATASYMSYLVDTQAGFVATAFPVGRSKLGISVNYVSYGDLLKTNERGDRIGTFGVGDLAVGFSAGRSLWREKLMIGGTVKGIFSQIDTYSSDAYAVDVGLILKPLTDRTSFGASLLNMGAARKGFTSTTKEDLPVMARIGLAHRLAHLPFTIVADAIFPNDNDPSFSIGGELAIGEGFFIRPGYSTAASSLGQFERSAGFSAGAGFVMKRYQIDYAFTSFSDLGDIHRVSIGGRW